MPERSDRAKIFLELHANWGKGMTQPQIASWESSSGAWSLEELRIGLKRCTADKTRTFAPQGFAEFSIYLPEKAEASVVAGWWTREGEWGGDWANVPMVGLVVAAAEMRAAECPRLDVPWKAAKRREFYEFCGARGITMADIDQGAEAAGSNGTRRWAQKWARGVESTSDA